MRGEVEIWDGDKLLHKESNLLVNGAGELLADIMTVSPSLSGITDHATSSILDSSNYTIQAISFGKDASAYQYNAHAMNSRRNLITFSTPSATDIADDNWYANYATVSSVPEITPPPKYADIPSSTAHVVALIEEADDFNGYLSYSQTNQYDWTMSGGQDNWICASVYVKHPIDEAAILPVPDGTIPDLTRRHPRLHFSYNLRGEGWDYTTGPEGYGGLGYARLGTTVEYATDTTPNYTTPSSMVLQYNIVKGDTNEYRSSAYGFSIENWRQSGGASYEGDGWYRVWTAGLAPVSGLSGLTFYMYPTSFMSDPIGITEGGMYTYGWQFELGRWPTELQFNNQNYQFNNWDVSGSVLNRDHSPGAVEDNGTVRVLNEPIPNPNLLFYTDDPGSSPLLDFPGGDTAGAYWNANVAYLPTFSSIVETGPFGDVITPSCIELSAVIGDGTVPTFWPYLTQNRNTTIESANCAGGPGSCPPGRPREFHKGQSITLSWYVKRPTRNLAVSAFYINVYDPVNPSNKSNAVYFEYEGGYHESTSAVPTVRGTPAAYLNATIEDAGNDWYRCGVEVSGLGFGEEGGETVEGDDFQAYFYMGTGPYGSTYAATSGQSLWISSPQIEQWPIGTKNLPTKYRAVAANVPTYAEDNLLTSSYTPTNYLSSPPNPESTRVEDGNTALFDTSCSVLSGFNMGQNLNVIPYREQGDQEPKFFECLPSNVAYGQDQYDWIAAYDNYTAAQLSGIGSLGPQAYYLGCYPEGSSTGGSNWALVSSLDNSAAYPINYAPSSDPNFVSGTYNSIVNEASSMDASGFVGKVYDPKQVVGNVPNPNKLSYTGVNGVADGAALPTNKAWTPSNNALVLASVSAVEITNPLGGASSTIMSGTGAGGTYARTGFYSHSDYTPSAIYNTSSRITISVFVKRPDSSYTSSMELGINATPGYYAGYMGIEWNSTPGVPTFKYLRPSENVSGLGYSIEDAGNDWYRLILSISGLPGNDGDSNKPIAGDAADIQVRIGDADGDADGLNINEKTAYIYGPQMEEHPVVYNLSATSYHEVAEGTPTIAEQNGTGGLHVSGGIDATNSGTVEYSMIVGSGDVGYSNLYGGIYNMGLWTIDMDESIKAGNTPPYSFGPLNNPRKYKLFATKHLTKNLGYIEDNGTNAGSLNYSDLTIKWRLHFL